MIKTFKEFITESTSKDILSDFWEHHKEHLHNKVDGGYFHQDNCGFASNDLITHLEKKHPNASSVEKVKTGRVDEKGNFKSGGFIRADEPQHGDDDLHPSDKEEMRSKGLESNNTEHRKKFVHEHPDKEKFHWIPHSWVEGSSRELTGRYSKHPLRLDPSGFHPSGKGQFDKKIKGDPHYRIYHKGQVVSDSHEED